LPQSSGGRFVLLIITSTVLTLSGVLAHTSAARA